MSTYRSNQVVEGEDAIDDIQHLFGDACNVEDDVATNLSVVHSVVKMKLNSFCGDRRLVGKINQVVLDGNVLLGEAYAFANFHIRRLLDDHINGRVALSLTVKADVDGSDFIVASIEPLAKRPIPAVGRQFFYRCLLAVSNSKCRPETLGDDFKASIKAFDALRPPGQEKVNIEQLNALVADLSITMATMASNHLWMNLERRLHAFVKTKYPALKGQWKKVVDLVAKRPKASVDDLLPGGTKCRVKAEMARDAVIQLRGIMTLHSTKRFASQAHLTLPLYFHMLRHEEERAQKYQHVEEAIMTTPASSEGKQRCATRRRHRLFTLLPSKAGFTISHVPISSMLMLKMLKAVKLEDSKTIPGDGRTVDALEFWRKHFNVNAVETRKRRFGGSIVTDGCGVSIVMKRHCRLVATVKETPSRADLQAAFALTRGVRIVGVDPGYHDVVTFRVFQGGVEAQRSENYSSARYYEKAKFNLSRRRTNKWNSETMALTKALPCATTASAVGMDHYVKAYLVALRPLTLHRHAKGYRNMRFLRYVHKRRAIEEICDAIAPPRRDGGAALTLVGFGDWKAGGNGSSPISRRTSGPLEEIKLALAGRDDVKLILLDEYKTSVTCNCCGGSLVNMRAKTTDRKTGATRVNASRIHRTLHCKSRTCCQAPGHIGTTWNRDVNASRNMLELMMCVVNGWPRPLELQRPWRRL